MILTERAALADIANALGLTTAVEIGTHQGVFASEFMERYRGTLHCVDPWQSYDELGKFYPSSDETTTDREQDLSVAVKNLDKFGNRVNLIRQTSQEALGYINFCDFVYIDGLHDYESVSFDVDNWFQKVTRGGIISGHDYHWDYPGVVRAVFELCERNSLNLRVTHDQMPSWWIIKP